MARPNAMARCDYACIGYHFPDRMGLFDQYPPKQVLQEGIFSNISTTNQKSIQSIAQLETDLARITSSTEMANRAKKLGFKEVSADRYTYMVIPGYNGKPSAILAPRLDPNLTRG